MFNREFNSPYLRQERESQMNDKQHNQLISVISNIATYAIFVILGCAIMLSFTVMVAGDNITSQLRTIDWTIHHKDCK